MLKFLFVFIATLVIASPIQTTTANESVNRTPQSAQSNLRKGQIFGQTDASDTEESQDSEEESTSENSEESLDESTESESAEEESTSSAESDNQEESSVEDDESENSESTEEEQSIEEESTEEVATDNAAIDWNERVTFAQEQLETEFWDQGRYAYHPFLSSSEETFSGFHYWWMAHAIDTLLDGYERTQGEFYLERIDEILFGVEVRTNDDLTNFFYDDMEWMGIAILRAYDLTGDEKYLDIAETLWEDILTGWNDHAGGGIAWQKGQLDYKNTPANAPAVILGLRLYQATDNEEYFDWSERIFTWLEDNLVDPETGFVWDGMNREGNMEIDYDWEFTYNQGIYAGASLEFYNVTQDEEYLDKALQTTLLAFEELSEEGTNILKSEGTGDGGLFKGVFVRYAALVQEASQNEELLGLMVENGNSAWYGLEDNAQEFFGASWNASNSEEDIDLATHLSGVMLMEANYRLAENMDLED